ncbi:restriction endonuclease subunit S [Achromobacter denitrificans]|uniref:Restriction endonuclease subunit S n=2 Tax=Pseudomonadota TaxID=1224 RepID=A0ABZ3G052_ACHDE|nr:restriction endonuclease subunit S [Stenotrophomonas maltophilia]MBO9332045.1 restriction endonuclease subunit S [Achromobacter xylosoxidans]
MSENKKQPLVPRLRFPKFRDAGEWITVELGKLSRLLTERVGSTTCTPYTITSGVGLISQVEKLGRTIAGNSLKNYLVLQENDFAYNKSATKAYPQGFIALYAGDERAAVPNSIFTCFRVNQNQVIPTFLDALFTNNLHGKWLRTRIAVGARAHGSLQVSDDDLMATPVPLPNGINSLEEQQKIADCLSSLDALVAAETQKLATLKTYRKGLMQQLFPCEGETVPRLRFPEFRNSRDWKEKSISDFGEIITGSTPSTAHPEFYGGGIPFVSPADISDLRWVSDTKTTLSALGFEKTRPIKANSVLFVCIGSTIGKVTQNVGDCATNQQINSVIPNSEHSGGFVYYTLSLNAERIAKLAGIQAVPIINKTQFSAVRLLIPELSEQERIANCLSSLDDFIAAQSQKVDILMIHKKGLMEQLFPVMSEVGQ